MFLKKIFLTVVFIGVFAFFISPANAMTRAELIAKINEIIAQIALLQQQLQQLQQPQQPQQSQQMGGGCYNFNNNLKIGDTSRGVTALQNYLKSVGFSIGTDTTGTFDNGTLAAVIAFQEKYKNEILTPAKLTKGNGYVGILTRAKLNQLYGCILTTNAPINNSSAANQNNINPISSTENQDPITNPQCQTLWWHDNNTTACQQKEFCGAYTYSGLQVFGTESDCKASLYGQGSITLNDTSCVQKDGWCCIGDNCKLTSSNCAAGITPILSGCDAKCLPLWDCQGSTINPPPYTTNLPPILDDGGGPTQLNTKQAGTWIIKAHDPEKGALNYKMDWGDGTSDQKEVPTALQSIAQSFTHSYINAGTYTVNATITDDNQNARHFSIKLLVVPAPNLRPVVDNISGPTKLKPNQTGTWSIKAHDPEGGTLNYRINWGDGTYDQKLILFESQSTAQSFTHSYGNIGTHTIEIIITDDQQDGVKGSVKLSILSPTVKNLSCEAACQGEPSTGEGWIDSMCYSWPAVGSLYPPRKDVGCSPFTMSISGDQKTKDIGWTSGCISKNPDVEVTCCCYNVLLDGEPLYPVPRRSQIGPNALDPPSSVTSLSQYVQWVNVTFGLGQKPQ